MKKIIITTALVSFAVISHAQLFIGGGIEFNSTSDKTTVSEDGYWGKVDRERTVSYSDFSFAPMIGYYVNDKFAIGASIVWNKSTELEKYKYIRPSFTDLEEEKLENTLFGIQPFVRYTFLQLGKFSVFVNAGAHFLTGPGKFKYTEERIGSWPYSRTEEIDLKVSSFGVNIVPVLAYNLTPKISLEAGLNFLNLGWNSTKMKAEDKDKNKYENNVSSFTAGVSPHNVVNVGLISVGFICKF
ncbi:MAG: PorT family protein [Bacteroidales bacterium]|nr:PorT family protein [Bacteroidales bacterium]